MQSGEVEAGIVPVENTIAGPVGVNMDLLLERPVAAIGEEYLSIEHCLLARPGVRLDDLRSARSHPVALAQCREFLQRRGLKAVPDYDTAGAAESVAREGLPWDAAIASREAAAHYGLSVVAEGIQSQSRNFTRFLAFVREDRVPAGLRREKTSLAFALPHRPGSLLDALRRFADRGLDLTRLESRPMPENPFEYVFFADVMGAADAPSVRAALDELKGHALRLKVIGSYPAAERPKG